MNIHTRAYSLNIFSILFLFVDVLNVLKYFICPLNKMAWFLVKIDNIAKVFNISLVFDVFHSFRFHHIVHYLKLILDYDFNITDTFIQCKSFINRKKSIPFSPYAFKSLYLYYLLSTLNYLYLSINLKHSSEFRYKRKYCENHGAKLLCSTFWGQSNSTILA